MKNKLDEIKAFFQFYSVIFLCTGILYNYIYLGHFGLEVSKFFTLNDYLATSIDKIILNLLPIVGSALVVLSPKAKLRDNKPIRFQASEMLLLMAFCAPGIIMIIKFHNPLGFYIIGLTAVSVIGYILSRTLLKGPKKMYELFYVTFILFFISGIWADAMSTIFHIEHDDISKTKNYSFFFEKNSNDNFLLNENQLVLLAANTNYYFFYEKAEKKTIIIPIKKVVAIERPPRITARDNRVQIVSTIQNKDAQQKNRGDRE